MYYNKELWDKVEQASLYSKESGETFTKICNINDIHHINPISMQDTDNSMTYVDDILKSQEIYKIKAQIDDINKTFADWLSKTVYSYKVICTTIKHQKRRHHKYRINKKWAKRYGYTYMEVQNEPIIFMDGTIYCTKDGLDQIKKICGGKAK